MNKNMESASRPYWEKVYWFIILFLFLISVIPRFYDIMKFLPVYSIDENDIVEFAVGFLGGNFDPHWYKYGPLYAYLLTVVYALQSLFSSLSFSEFVEDIFFNPTRFYYTARLINSLLNILIAVFTYRLAKKYFPKQVALLVMALAIFPFFDRLVNFTIRVDTLLALWTILTLYYLVKIQQEPGIKNYLLAAVFWGLSLATKPLPALLLLPTAFLAHWLCAEPRSKEIEKRSRSRSKDKGKNSRVRNKSALENLINALSRPAFYIFILAGIGVNFVFNPYSLINFNDYKSEQIQAVQSEGERQFIAGWDITRFFTNLGYVFTILAVIAVLYYLYRSIRYKNYLQLTLISYPLIFWLAFARGAAREYFYVPVIPVLILFIAQFMVEISEKVVRRPDTARHLVVLGGLLLVLWQPGADLITRIWTLNSAGDYHLKHTALAGKKWIEQNVPRNSKIILYGYYVNLPHLVDRDAQKQARFGEYFMYSRWKIKFLVDHFLRAHSAYLQAGHPAFNLENIRDDLREREAQLYTFCQANKIEYVISSYDLNRYPEFKGILLKMFANQDYPFGPPFAIYKLKDE
jgi:hypothetical protein